jgi:hypothetical protein
MVDHSSIFPLLIDSLKQNVCVQCIASSEWTTIRAAGASEPEPIALTVPGVGGVGAANAPLQVCIALHFVACLASPVLGQ